MRTRRERINDQLAGVRKRIRTLQQKKRRLLAERGTIPRKARAKTIGPKIKCWMPDEEELLREHYPSGGIRACMKLFPDRGRKAIQQHCYRLRIMRIKGSKETSFSFHIPPRPVRVPRSFEDQLQAVREGRATISVIPPRVDPGPTFTLGGVSAGWET